MLPRILRLAALAAIVALFLARFSLQRLHAFDPDEFQHLHGAWCIAKGLLPYRDYFDHHTPWLHFFLAPLVALFEPDTSPAAAEALVFTSRLLMVAFSGLALALTYRLGLAWAGSATAWAGTVLLSTCVMFLDKTLEVRPDVPALAFLLGSWTALLAGLRRSDEGVPARGAFGAGGFLLGVALLCTQKVLFTLPASALILAGYLLPRAGATTRADRLRNVLAHAAGAAAPIAVILAVFAAQGGLRAFVECNLIVNLRWPVRFSAQPRLLQLGYDNGLLVALAVAGVVAALVSLARAPRAGQALVPLHALGLAAGAFAIPVPTAQYLLLLLPPAALLAGGMAVRAVGAAGALRDARLRAAVVTALAVAFAGFSLRPLRAIGGMFRPGHTKVQDQIDRMRFLLAQSRPGDAVMDGFSGLGAFRPHAYFYFFLHDEVRVLLAGGPMGRLLGELRDGTIAPEWVIADRDVLGLPPEIVAFLAENYAPAGMEPIWRRRETLDVRGWLDLGEGPTDVLAGRGWSAPERDGDRTFRRARGRRSTVRLPVRDTACRTLVIRARGAAPDAHPPVDVAVNGHRVGALRLTSAWVDHAVPLGGPALRRGVNSVVLTGDAPEGSLVAVDGLGLLCAAR